MCPNWLRFAKMGSLEQCSVSAFYEPNPFLKLGAQAPIGFVSQFGSWLIQRGPRLTNGAPAGMRNCRHQTRDRLTGPV